MHYHVTNGHLIKFFKLSITRSPPGVIGFNFPFWYLNFVSETTDFSRLTEHHISLQRRHLKYVKNYATGDATVSRCQWYSQISVTKQYRKNKNQQNISTPRNRNNNICRKVKRPHSEKVWSFLYKYQ